MRILSFILLLTSLVCWGCSNDTVEPFPVQIGYLFNGNSARMPIVATGFDSIDNAPVPFGESRIAGLRPSGNKLQFTITDSTGRVLKSTNTVSASRHDRSMIVVFTGSEPTPDAFVSTSDYAGFWGVRIIHAAPSAGSYKLFSNTTQGELLSEALQYRATTPYIVPSSTFDSLVVVDQAGAVVKTLDFPGFFREVGRRGSLIIYGDPNDATAPLSIAYVDESLIS